MTYKFILAYTPTEGTAPDPRTVSPIYGNDLAVTIGKDNNEWFYTRKLDGKLTFVRDDYAFIMSCPIDGSFSLSIHESHDNNATFHPYFEGSFSRANLEIDEDHQNAVLNNLTEGIYNILNNAKNDDFDLRKLIPDSELRTVQAQIPPALALVDECSIVKPSFSDIYCNTHYTAGGYNEDNEAFWEEGRDMRTNPNGTLKIIVAEARLIMKDSQSNYSGTYTNFVVYNTIHQHGTPSMPDFDFYKTSLVGTLLDKDYSNEITISLYSNAYARAYFHILLPSNQTVSVEIGEMYRENTFYSPLVIESTGGENDDYQSLIIQFHYIYASLLTQSDNNALPIILDAGPYYKGMMLFNGSGLSIMPSANTSDRPNGHRIVPGSADYGQTPKYFAPPTDSGEWIPLAEDNWNFASIWYTITPSVQNGLLDPTLFGSFSWPYCFTIGTALKYLLDRISNHRILFDESSLSSHFFYDTLNPLTGGENFSYLITQKSNVMRPTANGAAQFKVRLNWFFELLRNAFNCFYWLEPTPLGTYHFRIEHVEYPRRGGSYNGSLAAQLDLTSLQPARNFARRNLPSKTYADLTNKYSFNLDNMVEKYSFAWQGDGGSDDFKGNPMFFRAGWIEQGSFASREVDNIFADLSWLILNAGTETESAKNYDGLFIFATYRYAALAGQWRENSAPLARVLSLAEGTHITAFLNIILTIPQGQQVTVYLDYNATTYTGTGATQAIPITVDEQFISGYHQLYIDFGTNYSQVVIHRIHAVYGDLFAVANTLNYLRPSTYLANGALAWPYLQYNYLHFDIPARLWAFDNYDPDYANFIDSGTIRLVKKQEVNIVPFPAADPDTSHGIRTGLGLGVIQQARINLSSRNAELTLIYDPLSPNNQ